MTFDCFGAGQVISLKANCRNSEIMNRAFSQLLQIRQMLSYLIDAYVLLASQSIEDLINENQRMQQLGIEEIALLDLSDYHQREGFVLKMICHEYPRYHSSMKNNKHKHFDNVDLIMRVLLEKIFDKGLLKTPSI